MQPVRSKETAETVAENIKDGEVEREGKRIADLRKGRSKGKGKGKKKNRKGDQLAMKKEEEVNEQKLCKLCNRETPLYFYQQEDVVKRLPERALT